MTKTQNAKHTSPPWRVETDGHDGLAIATGTGYNAVNVIEWPRNYCPEDLANAHLCAAAPDLLEALQDLVDRVDLVMYAGYVGHERIARCRAVIAKALSHTS